MSVFSISKKKQLIPHIERIFDKHYCHLEPITKRNGEKRLSIAFFMCVNAIYHGYAYISVKQKDFEDSPHIRKCVYNKMRKEIVKYYTYNLNGLGNGMGLQD